MLRRIQERTATVERSMLEALRSYPTRLSSLLSYPE